MNVVSINKPRAEITLGGVRPQTLLVRRASITIAAAGPQGPAGPGGGGGAAIQGSGTYTQNTGTIQFQNGNGVSFGLTNGVMTASITPVGGAQTGISTIAGGGTTITQGGVTLAGSGNVSLTNNNGSIVISGSTQTVQTQGSVQINGSTGAISLATGSSLSSSQNGSTITFGLASNITTALQSAGAYLTTAMQSNAGTGFMSTSERANYFATAGNTFANSTHSHGAPTLNLTNISGTTGSNSAGFTLSLSAAAPAGGGGAAIQGSGTYTQNTGTVQFANSNGVTFGLSNNGVMTASVQAGAAAGIGAFANSNTTYTSGTVAISEGGGAVTIASGTGQRLLVSVPATSSLSAQGGLTISTNGSTINFSVANAGGVANRSFIEIMQGERLTTMANLSATQFSRRPIFCPFWMDGANLSPATVRIMVSGAGSSNRSLVATFGVGLYSGVNATQLSLLGSDTQAFSITDSASSTVWNGVRFMDFTRLSSVTMTTEGRWVLGIWVSATSHNATYCNVPIYGGDPMPALSGFMIGGTTSATNNSPIVPFWGVYSTTTGGFPASVALSQVYGGNSASLVDAYAVIKGI